MGLLDSSFSIAVGQKAPDFALPDQHGQTRRLSDLLQGGTVVLYFYPRDETPGCTAQACSVRDQHEVFHDAGAQVVGVSADTVASHDAFARHHRLPFVLLADPDDVAHDLYGIDRKFGLRGRVTFVIDKGGTVRHVGANRVLATGHVSDALKVVKQLQGQSPAA